MKAVNYFIENTGEKYCLRVPMKVDSGDTEHLVIIKDKHSNGPKPERLLTFYDGLVSSRYTRNRIQVKLVILI